jgi:AraC family transcriptional regulator of adaptative response/methylated-DNA-[protein]-cysteine methyltransferase
MTDYELIEKSIIYLEENFQAQPSLEEISSKLNISQFYFQRMFKQWAGISPKRFLQFLTVEYAKNLLTKSRSVLDVAYETGLSGPGRLHDTFISVEAVTPGEYKSKGEGLRIFYGIEESPFGKCLIGSTERGICHFSFLTDDIEEIKNLKSQWEKSDFLENRDITGKLIKKIFPSDTIQEKPSIKLYLKGTNFQIKVWEALLKIPAGSVCSYEDVAKYTGNSGGTRSVATAIANNHVAYLIPCHRVIRKSGITGNYRWNPARKKIMIAWERAKSVTE